MAMLDKSNSKLVTAERDNDIIMAADMRYYVVPEVKEMLKKANSDEEKAKAAFYDQLLDEGGKPFFVQTIGSAQIRKMVEKLTSEGRYSPSSNPASKITVQAEGSNPLAVNPSQTARLSTDLKAFELNDTPRKELERKNKQSDSREFGDTSTPRTELLTSTPGPRHELATNPVRGKIKLESPEWHELPAAEVQRRPELEGSWVPDLPELGVGNGEVDDGDEKKEKVGGRWKGKLKGLIGKGK